MTRQYSSLAKPFLYDSQLKYRIGLVRKRLESHPLESMNFLMMDLERPQRRVRHAHWCTHDLTGRTLLFYSLADGVDGIHTPRLNELYDRIMNNRRISGAFGRCCGNGEDILPEKGSGISFHLVSGLLEYYRLTGDIRAYNAAIEFTDRILSKGDAIYDNYKSECGPTNSSCGHMANLADLYVATKDEKYHSIIRKITFEYMGSVGGSHSHSYLTALRGILIAGIEAKDQELIDYAVARRKEIIDSGYVSAIGDICEAFGVLERNEGCSIADWIMFNLIYAHYFGDDEAYAIAEHSLWNALYFNQFVTGGFGHRFFSGNAGYLTYIEEAWWCCTDNGGMSLVEVAKHAVTVRDGIIHVNFLIPGKYSFPDGTEVSISTSYPASAKSIINVTGTKEDLKIRIPVGIKNFESNRIETDFGYELHINGIMGHYIQETPSGTLIKYGPMVIAPMTVLWDKKSFESSTTIPKGYTHQKYSSAFAIKLGTPDENGFYHLRNTPKPEWCVFEEGEMAGISGGEAAAAYVPMEFEDGRVEEIYFHPLCSATSNLTLLDTPVAFRTATD